MEHLIGSITHVFNGRDVKMFVQREQRTAQFVLKSFVTLHE